MQDKDLVFKNGTQDTLYKVVLLGDGGVGKTSLVNRYVEDIFEKNYKETIGMKPYIKDIYETQVREVCLNGVRLQIWDVSGQKHFEPVIKQYVDGADGILLLFDLKNSESTKDLGHWIKINEENNENHEKCPILVIGTKWDLINQEKDNPPPITEKVNELTLTNNPANIKGVGITSSKDNINVKEAFCILAYHIYNEKNKMEIFK